MKEVTSEKYFQITDNIYSLVVIAAKRASSLVRGSKKLIPDVSSNKVSIIALTEISRGKIKLAPPPDEDNEEKK